MNTEVAAVKETSNEKVKPFRVAFIGCGGIAQQHMNYYTKFPGVTCVAGCDIRQVALDNWKKNWGVERLYKDFNVMLKELKGEVDAIDVCTPNGVHEPAAVAALKAGFHVLCEKPPAMSAKEAGRMVEAAKKAGKELVIGFQHRFEPRSKALRDMIAKGEFGKILYVRAQALRRRGIPNWGVFGQKELQGGGPMIDIGVHILETAHNIIGNPKPISATGNTFTYYGNKKEKAENIVTNWRNWDWKTYTVEDMAVGMIRFDTGTMLTIEASFVAHIERDVFNIQIMGEKGGAIWSDSQIYTDLGNYMFNGSIPNVGKWDMWEYKMKHFVEVARDGRKNECPGEHGLMVQKMLDGVYASADKGKEVAID